MRARRMQYIYEYERAPFLLLLEFPAFIHATAFIYYHFLRGLVISSSA